MFFGAFRREAETISEATNLTYFIILHKQIDSRLLDCTGRAQFG